MLATRTNLLFWAIGGIALLTSGQSMVAAAGVAAAGVAAAGLPGNHISPPRPLIHAVGGNARQTLVGIRPNWAVAGNDTGAMAGSETVDGLAVVMRRSPERQAAFDQWRADQQDPASSAYHHWLSSAEIGQRFGAADSDIQVIRTWLIAHNLQVDGVDGARTRVFFHGTAGALAQAWHAPLHRYLVHGDARVAPAGDILIPASWGAAVLTVDGLTTIRHQPNHLEHIGTSTAAHPDLTHCSSSGCSNYVFPADFATIYNINGVLHQNPSLNGSGQTVAIVGRARVLPADLSNFLNLLHLSVPPLQTIVANPGLDPGSPVASCTGTCGEAVSDQSEATLDVERVAATAPGATIKLVVSANNGNQDGVGLALQYAVQTDPRIAGILSVSFSACEALAGSGYTASVNQLMEEAAAKGISVLVSAGDSGAADCEPSFTKPTSTSTATASINALCASDAATCVGGTQFTDTTAQNTYWGSTGSNYGSALGYIPEGAWNESLPVGNPVSGGGGTSLYTDRPSWQHGTGVPPGSRRLVPDVSFTAAQHDAYFGCMAAIGGSCAVSNGSFPFVGFAGTSASAPSLAGIVAMLNQFTGGNSQGNINPRLYALAASSPAVFHDVNGASAGQSSCSLQTPSTCNNSAPNYAGVTAGYAVGAGYDQATGWGSLDVSNLLAAWGGGGGAPVFNVDQYGLTGSWYYAQTSGQGLEIEIFPDLLGSGQANLFAGWFTYDSSGNGATTWYVIQGKLVRGNQVNTLPVYSIPGGLFNHSGADAATQIGTATVSFTSCTDGNLSYVFNDGRTGSFPLQRLTANQFCTFDGATPNPTSRALLSGSWYNPPTSGQGFEFDMNPVNQVFFGAWYTFDPTPNAPSTHGLPRWYTIQTHWNGQDTSIFNAPIYATSGGLFNTHSPVSNVQVGTANVVFSSCQTATLTYSFNAGENAGLSGTLPITRVGPVPAGCAL